MTKINASHTKKLSMIAMFIALISIGAMFKIPVQPVPISFQFLFCLLAGLLLGGKLGAVTIIIYVIMGLVGIPVFTQGGGIMYVLKPTFGYMIGFIVGTFFAGIIAYSKNSISFPKLILASFVALFFVYAVGVVYLFLVSKFYLGSGMTFEKAFQVGCLVFLPVDSAWCVLASVLSFKLIPLLKLREIKVVYMYKEIAKFSNLKFSGIKLMKNCNTEYARELKYQEKTKSLISD